MRVLAVAVTYNPDLALLTQALQSVRPQVAGLAVVDNGSVRAEEVCRLASKIGAQTIANGRNTGIAAAQNQGIVLAQTGGFTHILLLDQDTVLGPATVADLADHLTSLERDQGRVAAVGPAYYEINSQKRTQGYCARGPCLSRLSLTGRKKPLASDFIIASGSLISLDVLREVGGFKEELFIDLVDVEWCFRARAAGYRSFLSPTNLVEHRLGSGTVWIGSRQVTVHVPERNYYWVRNALWLAHQPYTPFAWRIYFISRCMAFLTVYPIFANKRSRRLLLICRAIWDSFSGQFGGLK